MKKTLLFILCFVLIFLLLGCSGNNNPPSESETTTKKVEEEETIAEETALVIDNPEEWYKSYFTSDYFGYYGSQLDMDVRLTKDNKTITLHICKTPSVLSLTSTSELFPQYTIYRDGKIMYFCRLEDGEQGKILYSDKVDVTEKESLPSSLVNQVGLFLQPLSFTSTELSVTYVENPDFINRHENTDVLLVGYNGSDDMVYRYFIDKDTYKVRAIEIRNKPYLLITDSDKNVYEFDNEIDVIFSEDKKAYEGRSINPEDWQNADIIFRQKVLDDAIDTFKTSLIEKSRELASAFSVRN